MFKQIVLIALITCLATPWLPGQESQSEATGPAADDEKVHDELRALRDRMFAAYEKRDMDELLKDVAEDVVITWQNSERNRGHDEFKQFYEKMMSGDNKIVQEISSVLEVDEKSILYGDNTAVAHGTLDDHFVLSDGKDFTLNSKWTATLVRKDGSWKVASFHVSANVFDNPIMDLTRRWLLRVGLIGVVIGLVLGIVFSMFFARSKQK